MKNFSNALLCAFVICLFSQCEDAAEVKPVKEQKFRISSFTFGNGDVSSTVTYNDNEILVTQSNFYNDEVSYSYTLYKTDNEDRIIYIKEYSYDENCAMEKTIDYTHVDRVVCTSKRVDNQCEIHSISIIWMTREIGISPRWNQS